MAMSNEIGTKTQNAPLFLRRRKEGTSICLNCSAFLAYCGRPFTAKISCGKCGAMNVFEESQQPSSFALPKH
jgi:ribosomal protein S27AE